MTLSHASSHDDGPDDRRRGEIDEASSGPDFSFADELREVSNVLLSTPTMSSAETAACTELLGAEQAGRTDVLAITYARDPDRWLTGFRAQAADEPDRLNFLNVEQMVDRTAAGREAGGPDHRKVETLGSPRDLTGLGIRISEYLKRASATTGNRRSTDLEVCFDSVTALLQFVDPETAYRFLHALTGRLSASTATAHFHVHPDAIDDRTLNTVRTLFDGFVTVDGDHVADVCTR